MPYFFCGVLCFLMGLAVAVRVSGVEHDISLLTRRMEGIEQRVKVLEMLETGKVR